MSVTPQENAEDMDWRIQHMTTTTAPFTIPGTESVMQAGAAIIHVDEILHGKERLITTFPNATALFLNLSYTLHSEAKSLLRKCLIDKNKSGKIPDVELFNFYEQIMGSVVFGCTALEAFVNEMIPDTFEYSDRPKDGRFTRLFDKQQIERVLNLETKIGEGQRLLSLERSIRQQSNFNQSPARALKGSSA